MNRHKILFTVIIFLAVSYSCRQDPLSPVQDPVKYTGSWGTKWVIYDDVLNTLGGDILYYPYDQGKEVIFLDNVDDGTAYHGKKYFHFRWNGQPIQWPGHAEGFEHSYAGYSMIHTSNPSYYDMMPPLDLTGSKYTKITFYARGKLATGYWVKFEGPNNALLDNVTPTSNWTKYEVPLGDLDNVKDFFKLTIKYPAAETGAPAGIGGWVDLDYVAYEK